MIAQPPTAGKATHPSRSSRLGNAAAPRAKATTPVI